jgi:hypothetical protein
MKTERKIEKMSKNEEMILSTDPRAAELRTVQLWVSRNGGHYMDEDSARYDGCTHRPCSRCGAPAEKMYISCPACRKIAELEKYNALEFKAWDGQAMLYSEALDMYFTSADDIEEHLARDAIYGKRELMLMICEPEFPHYLDGDDHFVDQLAEDQRLEDVAPKLAAAIDEVNRIITEEKEILCWMPGRFRTEIEINYPEADESGE